LKKSWLQKIGIALGVVLLFVGYLQYREFKNSHFAVDKKAFNVKDSMNEVFADIYKTNPLLKNVFKYGIAVNVNKEVPIVGEGRTLRIEKAWLSSGGIYLLYSLDVLKKDQSVNDIPALQIKNVIFHRDNGPDFTMSVIHDQADQILIIKDTYNYRLYQQYMENLDFRNMSFSSEEERDQFMDDYVNHIRSVTLDGVKLVKGNQEVAVDDIRFPASFNIDKYLIKTIPVHQTISANGLTFQLENYQQYFDHGELNYKVETEESTSTIWVSADIKIKGRPKNYIQEDVDDPALFYIDGFSLYFPDIEGDAIVIKPNEYGYVEKKPIHIHIDKNHLRDFENNTEKGIKVSDITNGSIYFKRNGKYDPSFELVFMYDENKYPHVGEMYWMTQEEYKNIPEDERSLDKTSTIVDIKDERGHSLSFSVGNAPGKNGQYIYQFDSGPVDWLQLSDLNITLHSLVYVNKINADPFTIPLK